MVKETLKKPVAKKEKRKLGLKKYYRGVVSELKKVSWPTRKELTNYTGVVLMLIIIFAITVGIVDLGLGRLLELIT